MLIYVHQLYCDSPKIHLYQRKWYYSCTCFNFTSSSKWELTICQKIGEYKFIPSIRDSRKAPMAAIKNGGRVAPSSNMGITPKCPHRSHIKDSYRNSHLRDHLSNYQGKLTPVISFSLSQRLLGYFTGLRVWSAETPERKDSVLLHTEILYQNSSTSTCMRIWPCKVATHY